MQTSTKKLVKRAVAGITLLLVGAALGFFLGLRTKKTPQVPLPCGGGENKAAIRKLSIDQVWVGRGRVNKTLGDGDASYDDWRTTDGATVRVIKERYESWGKAHEAVAKRIAKAISVCQYGPTDDDESFVDEDGTWSRVVATFADSQSSHTAEVLIAFEFNEHPGSMITIIQAPSLAHALAKEKSHYRFDF